jgi:hypothetical protein
VQGGGSRELHVQQGGVRQRKGGADLLGNLLLLGGAATCHVHVRAAGDGMRCVGPHMCTGGDGLCRPARQQAPSGHWECRQGVQQQVQHMMTGRRCVPWRHALCRLCGPGLVPVRLGDMPQQAAGLMRGGGALQAGPGDKCLGRHLHQPGTRVRGALSRFCSHRTGLWHLHCLG